MPDTPVSKSEASLANRCRAESSGVAPWDFRVAPTYWHAVLLRVGGLAFAPRLNQDSSDVWRKPMGQKMKGIRTSRNELISDFDPFELDKLVMMVAPVVGVVLWLTEAPAIWWVGAFAWIGLWMVQREAKVRAGVSHYHEQRIAELERQVEGLNSRL